MKIGTSLALIAVGLILTYAVDFELPGLEIGAFGAILFFVGLLGLIVTVGLEIAAHRPRRPPQVRRQPRPEPVRRDESYDPVIPLARRPRDPEQGRTQVSREPGDDETRRLPRR
ncbi:MAG: hypothetical protein H0V26_12930 [Solirubrobacterales bacterium]|nr:hypothetical protein [Solirubrobacterales bacterium]